MKKTISIPLHFSGAFDRAIKRLKDRGMTVDIESRQEVNGKLVVVMYLTDHELFQIGVWTGAELEKEVES